MEFGVRSRLAAMISGLPDGFVRNLRWQYFGNIGAGALGGLYLLYLGRILGLEDFGLYALCLSIGTLVFNFSDFRIQEAIIRFVGHSVASEGADSATEHVQTLMTLDVCLRLLGLFAACAVAPLLASLVVKNSDAWPLICIAAGGLFLAKVGNAPAIGLLRLTDRFDLTAVVTLTDWAARFGVTVAAAQIWDLSPIMALAITAIVGGTANLFLLSTAIRSWSASHKSIDLRFPRRARAHFVQMRSFLSSSYGINVLDTVVRDLDTTLVGAFLSVQSAGLYRMVKSIAQLIWRAADPVFLVLMPVLSKFVLNHDQHGLRLFLRHLTILSLGAAILLVGGANIAGPIAINWFLPQFIPAISLIPWMTGWVIVALPLVWTHALAASAGRPDIQLRASLVGNLLGAALLFCLTPTLGTTGAAIAWSLGLATTFAGGYVLLRRAKVV